MLVAADFDVDGWMDLAVAQAVSSTAFVFRGDGNGGFVPSCPGDPLRVGIESVPAIRTTS